jgi:hypothetical protein
LRIPEEAGHLFRSKAAMHSERRRPPIPVNSATYSGVFGLSFRQFPATAESWLARAGFVSNLIIYDIFKLLVPFS